MKQLSKLVAKTDCTITPSQGRRFQIKIGQVFLVTSPDYRNIEGCMVDRERNAKANTGYYFTTEQIKELFNAV